MPRQRFPYEIWSDSWCFFDMHILLVLAIYFVFVLYGLTELFNFYFRQCILWKREISHSTTQPYQTQRWRQVKWQVSNPAIRNRVLKVKLKSLSSRKYMKTFFFNDKPKMKYMEGHSLEIRTEDDGDGGRSFWKEQNNVSVPLWRVWMSTANTSPLAKDTEKINLYIVCGTMTLLP